MTGVRAVREDEIPLARPVLGEAEEQRVLEVLRSGRLSLGPLLGEFERGFASKLGAAHACAVSSGLLIQTVPFEEAQESLGATAVITAAAVTLVAVGFDRVLRRGASDAS